MANHVLCHEFKWIMNSKKICHSTIYLFIYYVLIDLFGYREELSKCQEHMEHLQKDKELVSSEIAEAQSQNNM